MLSNEKCQSQKRHVWFTKENIFQVIIPSWKLNRFLRCAIVLKNQVLHTSCFWRMAKKLKLGKKWRTFWLPSITHQLSVPSASGSVARARACSVLWLSFGSKFCVKQRTFMWDQRTCVPWIKTSVFVPRKFRECEQKSPLFLDSDKIFISSEHCWRRNYTYPKTSTPNGRLQPKEMERSTHRIFEALFPQNKLYMFGVTCNDGVYISVSTYPGVIVPPNANVLLSETPAG